MPKNLENKFNDAIENIYTRVRSETNYNPTQFRRMVNNHGGLQAARILINSNDVSSGYIKLWELKRLDLSIEAFIVKSSQFHDLFATKEIEDCKGRLQELGYKY